MEQMPPKLQERLVEFQQLQKQAQTLVQQRMHFELELSETEKALKELESLKKGAEIYQSIGVYMISSDKDKVLDDLKEKKEALAVRIKTFKNQEERFTEKLKTMKAEIENQLKGFTPTAG